MARFLLFGIINCFILLLNGQCCTNGINLLVNGDFEDKNFGENRPPRGFETDNIWESSIISPGYYIVLPFRNYGACFNTPQYDHTKGDSNGLFLWYDVDNSRILTPQNPAIAYKPSFPNGNSSNTNILPVKKNTFYIFSCWIRDIARETDCISGGAPVMGLRINGQDLAEIDLGRFTSPCCPEWVQLCAEWYSGDSDTAQMQIESRSTIGFTDLGIDDVYFGESIAAVGIKPGFLRDTIVCPGEPVELMVPVRAKKFSWEDGSTSRKRTVNKAGVYALRITDSCNNSISDTSIVKVYPNFISKFDDTTICSNLSLLLNKPKSAKQWTVNGSAKQPFISNQEKLLLFSFTDSSGCIYYDTSKINYINCNPELRLCNVFTPGTDGINDKWRVINKGYKQIDVRIVNRWGEVVARYSLPTDEDWNGRVFNKGAACPEGIYFYTVIANEEKSQKTIHGCLSLFREGK